MRARRRVVPANPRPSTPRQSADACKSGSCKSSLKWHGVAKVVRACCLRRTLCAMHDRSAIARAFPGAINSREKRRRLEIRRARQTAIGRGENLATDRYVAHAALEDA